MGVEDVVAQHSSAEHRVFMIGFLPGCPYMGGLPDGLSLPRRTDPRIAVPAGSVAIAVGQTVIYPVESPGGWHLIGRCPVPLFDAGRPRPALLGPGDRVRFEPVARAEHDRIAAADRRRQLGPGAGGPRMNGLRIIDPGLATSVQDLGRFGHQRAGVPVSGALDPEALVRANALVGNPPGAAALEMRFQGPSFEVTAPAVRIAVVGAEIDARVERDGERMAFGQDRTVTLGHGDRVRIGTLRASTTATLAVRGGIDVPEVLGSRATFLRSRIGGFRGRLLAAGDVVPVGEAGPPDGPDRALARPFELSPPPEIRVVLGPQDDHFTDDAVATLLGADWTASARADRMGVRLEGPELAHRDGYNIVSDGIVSGAIQVPGTRQPIVLLADRQTSGGYPKIATVIGADLPALGRLGPGARIRFAAVSAAEGARIARAAHAARGADIAAIRDYAPAGVVDDTALWRENLIQPPIGLTEDP